MILKEIGRKIVQAFRSVKGADEKVASSIATSLDTIAERARKYEKSFEPEPPGPDLPQEINTAPPFTFEDKFNRWYDVYAEDIRDEARMEIRNLIDELE